MENKLSYRFAPLANSDLDSILNYIESELKNPKAAEDFAISLFKKIDSIREFPESGLAVNNEYIINQELRRFIVDNYVVFYMVNEQSKTIIIVRIVYGKRNMDDILKRI